MSRKDGYSRRGIFGGINHYDENGRKTGHSSHGFLAAGIITMIKAERRKKNGKNIYHIDRDKALFWK